MDTWSEAIGYIKQEPYFAHILQAVAADRALYTVYPPKSDVFSAFRLTDWNKLKVVILGQDPYHGPNQANGLAFSVHQKVSIPPSLHNIYEELLHDIPGFQIPTHGSLKHWAEQGVFLLNTVLTVRAGAPQSHQGLGWQRFTDEVFRIINKEKEHVVFMLWGSSARAKRREIDENKHLVLTAPHPSPLSAYRGFFGCQHFSKANAWLKEKGLEPIDWQV